MPDAAPRRLALLALVDARFYGNGPHPLQLVCTNEDDSDAECGQAVAEVEPGATWDELEERIAAHAAERHAAAAPRPLTAQDVVAGLLADVGEARDEAASLRKQLADLRMSLDYAAGQWAANAMPHTHPARSAEYRQVMAECARDLRHALRANAPDAEDVRARFAAVTAELATCRERNAAIAAQLDQYRNERDGLRALVADILQSMPDTADEQEWRDLAGTLGVTDPDGQPYRAWNEDDL
jgi:hypothetical protein